MVMTDPNLSDDFIQGKLMILRNLNNLRGFPFWVIYLKARKRIDDVWIGRIVVKKDKSGYSIEWEKDHKKLLNDKELNYVSGVEGILTQRYK